MACVYKTTSTPVTSSPSETSEIITMADWQMFNKAFVPLRLAACLVGMWTNALNIRAFYRIGLEDSVTIVFFCLAVSDFIHLFLGLITAFVGVVLIIEFENYMEFPPLYVQDMFYTISRAFTEITYLSTAFLAIQRCLCVFRPLHFKNMFTKCRTYFVLAVIWCPTVTFTIVFFLYSLGYKKIKDPVTNLSRYISTPHSALYPIKNVYITTYFIVLNTTIQVVVTGCVFVMAHALKKSVRFRQMTSSVNNNTGAPQQTVEKTGTSEMTSSKERQAIIQVALVSVIFLACNTLRLAVAFAMVIEPEFYLSKSMVLTFELFYQAMTFCEYINSSVNFCVYYKYNTRFKKVCFEKET